ncbi:hypothetical protein SCB49_07402 [unidentified eubacterium SCB49]|nr:hypothetical protein SCB49_07402 [unidentified eubacterium SCB49]
MLGIAQVPAIQTEQDTTATLAVKKVSPFNTGFYPVGFFDFDLKYLIKYNDQEGLRLGLGGMTNKRLSEKFRINGYAAYGTKDKKIKHSVGGSYRIDPESKTWITLQYRDDINEIGAAKFLTDDRVYSVFEPRLVNVTQYYNIRTWQTNIITELTDKIAGEIRFGRSRIDQLIRYKFINNGITYDSYEVAEATASIRISPKTKFFTTNDGLIEYYDGFPKISAQITKGISDIVNSDFNYTKFGLKLDYYVKRTGLSSTNFLLEGNLAIGDVPLTHLYHAYPNSPNKQEILRRFSVAGRRSFETMYFGEFFSDKLASLQIRHSLKRFEISEAFRPELVFITRHALGDLSNPEAHQGINFNTLDQIYNEAGLELNKLIFGFGLSFAYRYGAYHLPATKDNIAFKFTFYAKF